MSEVIVHSKGDHDRVVFEHVADQYVKGDDVTAYFTALNNTTIYPNEDQIGLLRVGCTNIDDCLAFARVEFKSPSTPNATRNGTAAFLASSLPATDDEFYQFCYITNKRKILGSSIPFQLNCSIDDIDLLSQSLTAKTQLATANDGLISINDNDSDDLVVVHTKRMLTEEKLRQENRQLLEANRRLQEEKDQCQTKLETLEVKSTEYINKVKTDMQTLIVTHKSTIEELSTRQRLENKLRIEYEACRELCSQYQTESLRFAERCRMLEDSNVEMSNELNKLRSQLTTEQQLQEEGFRQIKDLEQRLAESTESLRLSQQYRIENEQKLNDLRLTTEKYQLSFQGQIEAYIKQAAQQENKMRALETANGLLKEELNAVKSDNKFLLTIAEQDKQTNEKLQRDIEKVFEEKNNEIDNLRKEIAQLKQNENSYVALKNSFSEIEKRCVKHQKSEIDVKKQLTAHQQIVVDLENQIQDLAERLAAGADEYKNLYRKYMALERMIAKVNQPILPVPKQNPTTLSSETGLNEEALVTLLRNSYEIQQKDQESKPSEDEEEQVKIEAQDEEAKECPMCYWEFPRHLTLDNKKEHIENHFV